MDNVLSLNDVILAALKHGQSDNYLGAIETLKKGMRLYPHAEQLPFLLGAMYVELGDTDAGLKNYQLTVELNPAFYIARLQLGMLYACLGRPEDARDQWLAIAEGLLDQPNHYLKLFSDGLVALCDNRTSDAELLLKQGLEVNQENLALNGDIQTVLKLLDDNRLLAEASEASVVDVAENADESVEKPVTQTHSSHLLLNLYNQSRH